MGLIISLFFTPNLNRTFCWYLENYQLYFLKAFPEEKQPKTEHLNKQRKRKDARRELTDNCLVKSVPTSMVCYLDTDRFVTLPMQHFEI